MGDSSLESQVELTETTKRPYLGSSKMVKTKRGKAKTPTNVVKSEDEVSATMKKAHPTSLFNHMCRSAMIPSPVSEVSEGKAPYTVTIYCYNKQLKVTFPEELTQKGLVRTYANHLLFKQFYEDYELPEEVQTFADIAAKPVAKTKYESDIKSYRMKNLGSCTADIKKWEDDTEADADKREYKLYNFKQRQEKYVNAGTTVTLPPFSGFKLEVEAKPPKDRDACREFTVACKVFNLDAAFEKHDPEITGNVIKNGCSVTVHKKAETEEGEMEFLFRLDHELENTLPDWKQLLKDAKAGKKTPEKKKTATVGNVRQGLCEMAIAKLIEDGIMEDENAAERILKERKEEVAAIRTERAAAKAQRRAEHEAAVKKKQEKKKEKEARKAEMEAKKAEKDRLKAERKAAHEAREAEAKRNKEQRQRNAQRNKGRNNQGGANNNKNKPGQKRNWNQQ